MWGYSTARAQEQRSKVQWQRRRSYIPRIANTYHSESLWQQLSQYDRSFFWTLRVAVNISRATGGLLLMNGLPAHAFHSQAAKACVWRDNPCHLSGRGWKILLHFSHLSLVRALKSAFVNKRVWGLILGVHPGRLNQCGRLVLLFVNCILVKMLGHVLFKNAIFVCMYDIDRQAVGLSRAWHCCRDRLVSWTDQIRITSLACICPANDPGPEWHYAVLQHYCMLQFAHTGHLPQNNHPISALPK